MTLIGTMARAALFAYPSEFRTQFGEQILADIEHDPSHAFGQLIDLVKGAFAMRFDSVARDVSYAIRRLRAAPLFVALVVLTFALGIGANVAVFSVLERVVLRPLPFANPSSLAVVNFMGPDLQRSGAVSVTDAGDLASRSRTISAIAAAREDSPTLLIGGKPYSLDGLNATPNYLSLLGISPQLGRGFIAADGNPGARNVIISHELWRKRFNADPHVLGTTILLDRQPARIIGVLRPHQLLLDPNGSLSSEDFLRAVPWQLGNALDRGNRTAGAWVRLAPGITIAKANAELALVSERLQKLYPKTDAKLTFSLKSLDAAVLGRVSSAIWIFFAAAAGILVIACANVGNLLAARWSSRDRELAVRRALGASSRSIAAQLLIETGLLAAIGAIVGVAIAIAGLRAMAPMIAQAFPRGSTVAIDGWSLFYAVGVVVLATLLSGLSPLLSVQMPDLQTTLKSAGRGGDSSRRNALRAALVVAEIALALALVVTSGLMLRNFVALVNTPLGIRPHGVVVTDATTFGQGGWGFISGGAAGNSPATRSAGVVLERQLLQRLRALPGVESAALATVYPLGNILMETSTKVVGRSYAPGQAPIAAMSAISPGYFRTLGTPIARGRDFSDSDTPASAPVAIVNETFVARYLTGTEPIGAQLRLGFNGQTDATIVGVVRDQRQTLTDEPRPEFYQPEAQFPDAFGAAVVYAPHVAPATIEHEIQGAFATTMPFEQPPDAYTMGDRVARAAERTRFATVLLGTLAAIALLLALAGIFGVVSFSVSQRLREFGVRIALGATAPTIVAEVLRRSLVTTAAGVALGLALAAFAAHAIAGQLDSLSPFDPITFGVVVALIFVCSMLASLQPAVRATRVEPAEVLRYE
jgi:putative ABC transport system permease protein